MRDGGAERPAQFTSNEIIAGVYPKQGTLMPIDFISLRSKPDLVRTDPIQL